MNAHTGTLSGRIEAIHDRGALGIDIDPSHRVMLRRLDRDGGIDGIYSCKINADFPDAGKSFFDLFLSQMPQIQMDILIFKPVSFINLCLNRARNDIPGRQLHG